MGTPESFPVYYELRITAGGITREEARLLEIVSSTKAYTVDARVNVRRAAIFYREDGSRIASVYFDEECRHALVGDQAVTLQSSIPGSDLCGWMRSKLKGVDLD